MLLLIAAMLLVRVTLSSSDLARFPFRWSMFLPSSLRTMPFPFLHLRIPILNFFGVIWRL